MEDSNNTTLYLLLVTDVTPEGPKAHVLCHSFDLQKVQKRMLEELDRKDSPWLTYTVHEINLSRAFEEKP